MDRNQMIELAKGALQRGGQALSDDKVWDDLVRQLGVPELAGKGDATFRANYLNSIVRGNEQVLADLEQRQSKTPATSPQLPETPLDTTEQDRALVAQSIGAAGDIARRELEATLPTILGQVSGQIGAQGLTGGSAELATRGLAGAQAIRSVADLLSQQQSQGGQALLELPFQRGQLELGRGQLALGGRGLDIQRELGLGELDIKRRQLASQERSRNQDIWASFVRSITNIIPLPTPKSQP